MTIYNPLKSVLQARMEVRTLKRKLAFAQPLVLIGFVFVVFANWVLITCYI